MTNGRTMTDPNDLDPNDLRALDHLRERLAMPRGDLAAIRATLDKTGDYNGTLPDRVQKLVNDWRAGGRALIRISALVMAGENESAADAVDRYVSTTRQQFAGWVKVTENIDTALTAAGIEQAQDLTLAQRVAELARQRDRHRDELINIRILLDDHNIAGDIPAAVAMLLQERAERRARTPPAPDVAPGGVEWGLHVLYIDGKQAGQIFEYVGGWGVSVPGRDNVLGLPNEPTARAVLLALAGQECGRVEFDLRPGATWETILMMRARGLGWVVDALLGADGVSSRTADPEIVRAWVAHGQAALTIEAVSGV
jgi:hypothetical protein